MFTSAFPQPQAQFCELLAPHFRLEELERHPASVFGLSPDLRISYVNPAWQRFAVQNGAAADADRWGIGTAYLQTIPEPLQPFYAELLQRAVTESDSMRPVTHVYECSTAELFRQFRMQVYALPEQRGFVVVNTLAVEKPHDPDLRPEHAPDVSRYMDARGRLVQCAHCRLVASADRPGVWDWVPQWVDRCPPNASHGICPMCVDYFYPDTDA